MGGRSGMLVLRLAGLFWFVLGVANLVLLITPAKDWLLRNNLTDLTSLLDRRASNTIGGVDTPETVVIGGVIAIVVGLWVGVGVPFVLDRGTRVGPDGAATDAGTTMGRWFVALWIVLWLAMLGGLALWSPWW